MRDRINEITLGSCNDGAGTRRNNGAFSCSVTIAPGSAPGSYTMQGNTPFYYQASFAVVTTAVVVGPAATQLVYPGTTGLTITVTGAGTPTGAVTIYDGSTAITSMQLGPDGQAYWSITPGLNTGTHQISAAYGGEAHNAATQSAPVTIEVSPAPVVLSASCGNSSFPFAEGDTCTATVSASGTTPVGAITYTLDTKAPVSVSLTNGTAGFTVSKPAVGNHTLVIAYAAQGNFLAAPPLSASFTVTQAVSDVTLTASGQHVKAGSPVTLSASVTSSTAGPPAGGKVTFLDNGTVLGKVKVNAQGQASFTVSKIALGLHRYVAKYAGTVNFSSTSSKAVQVTAF